MFGRIQGQAIASLWKSNPHLTHMNLRDYNQRTDVNIAIGETITNEPENFWYFNNGLTFICESITPSVYGRSNPAVSLFNLEGISLVNGAQTAGIVADKIDELPESEKEKLWLQVRAIAVKSCPSGFERRITQSTNLQNAITIQDWVSLDPVQSRIATDFAIEKRRYAFRWGGAEDPVAEQGCTLKEATLALAGADADLWYAVQAKRAISVLWDIDSPRYRHLFPEDLNASTLWNAVRLFRVIEATISVCGTNGLSRSEMIANHLQRVILHAVFQHPRMTGWNEATDIGPFLKVACDETFRLFDRFRKQVVNNHTNEYLASFSKNLDKCRDLVNAVMTPDPSLKSRPGELPFPE